MVSSHIAHDCLVEDNVILANNVPLGGHAHIEENVIIAVSYTHLTLPTSVPV